MRDALEQSPKIIVTKPMLLLKLLRNFGHSIRNLGIHFRTLNDKLCIEIENYLVKYCSNSLQRLILVSKSKLLFEKFTKTI